MNDDTRATMLQASRPVRYAAAAALSVLALFLLVKTFDEIRRFGHGDNPPVNTITVTGTGESAAMPDIARISFTVQQTAANTGDAQAAATKQTDDVLAAMNELGIEEKDVKTTGYNIYPQYADRGRGCGPGEICPAIYTPSNTITGYQVSQSVDLTIRDTAKAGDVLQKLGTLGVQNVSGPNFSVDDDTTVSAEARAMAINDAKEKAKELARQLGVDLGDVVSFSENGGYYPMLSQSKSSSMDSMESAAPQLPMGEDERTVTVQVTYEIH